MKHRELKSLFQDDWYSRNKFEKISGRYIVNEHLDTALDDLKEDFEIEEIGKSVEGRSIKRVKVGTGKIPVLMWSQMHGNESTTTKALIDLLNTFKKEKDHSVVSGILSKCTIYMIPILNPDGAYLYTRQNANSVDLNRDLQDLSQPESKLLKKQYLAIKPAFCLNLHDQRTIFSAGELPKPATLSFLTPSKDEGRNIDEFRKQSMAIIAGMAEDIREQLPGQIGRYDDAFNLNCAGDTFQSMSTPTILFEAGHFPEDYEREETRKYVYRAYISCLYQIANRIDFKEGYEDYFKIPENQKLFQDVILRNALLNDKLVDVVIQYKEEVQKGEIVFKGVVEEIGENVAKFAHREIDARGEEVRLPGEKKLTENVVVNKIILKTAEFSL
ncbi:peptidase M14 [Gramella sp. GC03-9]|uniref:Peptidase M14 n=1 Tax=Christiangramia oceanisediminis TaxID=2920386 RepID=A0A9X2RCS3_9FLAO|nr:M14 family zinc carboxypeptidase [Gramella oceanisediminis]MCP9200321.1 peptidase M14 [Gramella oceanisediminis]